MGAAVEKRHLQEPWGDAGCLFFGESVNGYFDESVLIDEFDHI